MKIVAPLFIRERKIRHMAHFGHQKEPTLEKA
jgi:hypothetical protein